LVSFTQGKQLKFLVEWPYEPELVNKQLADLLGEILVDDLCGSGDVVSLVVSRDRADHTIVNKQVPVAAIHGFVCSL